MEPTTLASRRGDASRGARPAATWPVPPGCARRSAARPAVKASTRACTSAPGDRQARWAARSRRGRPGPVGRQPRWLAICALRASRGASKSRRSRRGCSGDPIEGSTDRASPSSSHSYSTTLKPASVPDLLVRACRTFRSASRSTTRPKRERLADDVEQVDEYAPAQQAVDLVLPRGISSHQPFDGGRLVGRVVVEVHRRVASRPPRPCRSAARTRAFSPSSGIIGLARNQMASNVPSVVDDGRTGTRARHRTPTGRPPGQRRCRWTRLRQCREATARIARLRRSMGSEDSS